MKNISGNKKISVKAGTADGELFKDLIEQDGGVKKLLVAPGITAYLMGDGSIIEIYGAGFCYPAYLFSHGNIVVSFKVKNVESTAATLMEKGASLLGEIESVSTSYRYCHLLTQENTVIGIYEIS